MRKIFEISHQLVTTSETLLKDFDIISPLSDKLVDEGVIGIKRRWKLVNDNIFSGRKVSRPNNLTHIDLGPTRIIMSRTVNNKFWKNAWIDLENNHVDFAEGPEISFRIDLEDLQIALDKAKT